MFGQHTIGDVFRAFEASSAGTPYIYADHSVRILRDVHLREVDQSWTGYECMILLTPETQTGHPVRSI